MSRPATHERVAIVTGGSRGIGRAVAERFAAGGHPVALTYRERAREAEDVVRAILARGGRAIARPYELGDRGSACRLLEETRRELGEPLVLVNNAALLVQRPFLELTDDDWSGMLATNLQGPFQLAQECLPAMKRAHWGRIVNLSSIGAQTGGTLAVHYAAAKAGILSLTRSVARAFAADGITCNAVSPGLVETEMIAAELATAAGREKLAAIPVGRITTAEEVAAWIAFICDDSGATVTGQTLGINGGLFIA
jgi:acetoacetyl-CoA reductase/3-oxoacyl-[acyl-carrier protein] reductase